MGEFKEMNDHKSDPVFTDPSYKDTESRKDTYSDPKNRQPGEAPGSGFAVASLILGIISLILFCATINLITAVLGIVFGAIYLSKGYMEKRGMAIAGLVLSIISVALWILCLAVGLSVISSGFDMMNYYNF